MNRTMLVLSLCLLPSMTLATVVPHPVKVRVANPDVLVNSGDVDLRVEILSPAGYEPQGIQVLGDGVSVMSVTPATLFTDAEGQSNQSLDVRLKRSGFQADLLVAYDFLGKPYEKRIDLDPFQGRSTVIDLGTIVGRPRLRDEIAVKGGRRVHSDHVHENGHDDPNDDGPKKKQNITVRGQFQFQRNNESQGRPFQGGEVEVYDEDTGFDELLASGNLNANGEFDFTFNWDPCFFCDSNPDIYVEAWAEDGNIEIETTGLENNYNWDTHVVDDFTGTLIDFGGQLATSNEGAMYMFMLLHYAFQDYSNNGYGALDTVDVQWPESGQTAYYNPVFEEIHFGSGRTWNEGSLLHELGHHWQDHFSDTITFVDYCDPWNNCNLGGDCNHCMWCQEYFEEAEAEASAHFLSFTVTPYVQSQIGMTFVNPRSEEDIDVCQDPNQTTCPCNPPQTEGFIFAALQDLADDTPSEFDGTWTDLANVNAWALVQIEDLDTPENWYEWWGPIKRDFPNVIEDVWQSLKLNGFDIDSDPPQPPTNLFSPSHNATPGPDSTIEVRWTRATDDASGVAGYAIEWNEGFPVDPGTFRDVLDVVSVTSQPLGVGDWYFSIRTQDPSGKWSTGYVTIGPLSIREPYPSDMRLISPAGWYDPVIPYPTIYSGPEGPPYPGYLLGGGDTYWSIRGQNYGESSLEESMAIEFQIDGVVMDYFFLGGASPWMNFGFKNIGPVTVRGGRHSMVGVVDANEVVHESIEWNNDFGEQYVWTGTPLGSGLDVPAPPNPVGGWESVVIPNLNVDGYSYNTGTQAWSLVWMNELAGNADYDLRLYPLSTGPDNGYSASIGWSGRAAGCTDIVLSNNTGQPQTWDVGFFGFDVVNTASARLRVVHSTSLGSTASHYDLLTSTNMVDLYDFDVPVAEVWVTIELTVTEEDPPPVYLARFDQAFGEGDIDDAEEDLVTDANGKIQIVANLNDGNHGLVVYRDPKDGLVPVDYTLDIYPAPADLVATTPPGWFAPMVPTSGAPGTQGSTPAPTILNGYTNDTYFNMGTYNQGQASTPNFNQVIEIDGQERWNYYLLGVASGQWRNLTWATPQTVRGGRHTIAYRDDPIEAIQELDDTNNAFGAQWSWTPQDIEIGDQSQELVPEARFGGWGDVTSNANVYENSDGFRLATPDTRSDGNWQAVAAMSLEIGPVDGDVDLTLHEASDDPFTAFTEQVTQSNWGHGPDFLLINNLVETPREFDVGVQAYDAQTSDYRLEAVTSADLGAQPIGTHPPFGTYRMESNDLVHLYEFSFNQLGDHTIRLLPNGSNIDFGIALYPSGDGFFGRSDYLETSWFEDPDEIESITITVSKVGSYCLVVFKAKKADVSDAEDYRLAFYQGPTGNNPVPVQQTALRTIRPNPFNPRTSVSYELAKPGDVSLEIYNVAGERVRLLESGHKAAGRYDVPWNGNDDRGRRVSSGMYFVRFRAPGVDQRAKVTLLK